MNPISDAEIATLLEADEQCVAEVRSALAKFGVRQAKHRNKLLNSRGYVRPGPKVPAPVVQTDDYVEGRSGTIAVGKSLEPLESIVLRWTESGGVLWFVDDVVPATAAQQPTPNEGALGSMGPFFEGTPDWEGARWEFDQALEAHRKGAPEGEIVCRFGWYYVGMRYFTSRASAYNYRRDHR